MIWLILCLYIPSLHSQIRYLHGFAYFDFLSSRCHRSLPVCALVTIMWHEGEDLICSLVVLFELPDAWVLSSLWFGLCFYYGNSWCLCFFCFVRFIIIIFPLEPRLLCLPDLTEAWARTNIPVFYLIILLTSQWSSYTQAEFDLSSVNFIVLLKVHFDVSSFATGAMWLKLWSVNVGLLLCCTKLLFA